MRKSVLKMEKEHKEIGEKYYRDLMDLYAPKVARKGVRESFWTVDPIKENKFYHKFMLGEREVTLCILTLGNNVLVGYSIKVPEDENIEGLSRKISYGRAKKRVIDGGNIDLRYASHKGTLKGIAFYWESEFKKDITKYVKGVR
jgi:hypothetical protein